MTSPRTPRQWAEGDTIPADVTAVHHHHEPLLDECGTQCAWIRRTSDWKGPWGYALEEAAMLRRMGPVTEVVEGVPLSEVLPETPEAPQAGCCGACSGKGHVQGEACSDCLGSGHAHDPDDPCPAPEPSQEGSYFDRTSFADEEAEAARAAQAPAPASQSVPAVPESSTGGKETGEAAETATEELRDALADLLDAAMERNQGASLDSIEAWDFDTDLLPIADAILAAGWRPPLPKAESARWQITVQVPAAVPVEQRQELFSRVAEVAHDWEPDDRDGWDVDVSGHLGEYLWVENQRLRTLIGDLDRKIAASSPLPDSETERAKVVDFCAERAEYITAINNCPAENTTDYHRWQGHAEARRELSERLMGVGLPPSKPLPATDFSAHVVRTIAGMFASTNRQHMAEWLTDTADAIEREVPWPKLKPKPADETEWGYRRKGEPDEVLVLNVGGYIGESTRGEIAYAEKLGKPITYLEPTEGQNRGE